MHIYIPS